MPDARLRVTDPQGRRLIPIDKSLFTIGRRTAADLQIVSTDVSREHAEIVRDGEQYVLRDRGSRYGTFVNGDLITEHTLEAGDRIRLGRTEAVELVFQGEDRVNSLRETAPDLTDLRQMAAVLNGLRALGSGRVLPEVLTLVMDSAIEVARAERGFLMLANDAGELEFKVARGRAGVTLTGTSFATSEKIPRQVFTTGESRIVGDLLEGSLAGAHDGTIAVGIRCVLCVPLRVLPMRDDAAPHASGRIIGVLYLDGRERSTMQSPATLSSLEAFGTQAAIAIESARLYAESAEKARLERDLMVAAEIQRALLPEPTHRHAFCDLAAVSIPCRTVGGDFYDYLPLAGDEFAFALGDVAGKGPPAALQAAALQSNFAALVPVSGDPAAALVRINAALLRRAVEARFATMFYGVLHPDGTLRYANAGQEPPFVVREDDSTVDLDIGGPVLGLFASASFEFGTVRLAPGDLVVICSDGVSEGRSPAGDEFTRERLVAALAGAHGTAPEAVLEAILSAVRAFVGAAPQADDLTVLIIRYTGPPRASA